MSPQTTIWKLTGILALLLVFSLSGIAALAQNPTPPATPPCDQGLAGTSSPCVMLEPGDQTGRMRLAVQIEAETFVNTPSVYHFCNPGSTNCAVPPLNKLAIGPFQVWRDAQARDADWAKTSWQLYFDGHPIDLTAFGTVDFDYIFTDYKARAWKVVLENPTPGSHVVRVVTTSQAGTQDLAYQISIQETPCPPLPESAATGTPPAMIPIQDSEHSSFLGVGIEEANCGVRVDHTEPKSQAYQMELGGGDLIRAIDGLPTLNIYQLCAAIRSHRPGESMSVIIDRSGEQIRFNVKLGAWPSDLPMSMP